MKFLSRIVSPALHEAAVRAGLRTALVTLAPALVIPGGVTVAISGQWLAALGISLLTAAVIAFVAGLSSYASFIAKGIPEPYVTAALEQTYAAKHVALDSASERGPPVI